MPNEMTPELYAQFASAANAKRRAKNELNPYEPEFYGITGSSPTLLASEGEPQRYLPESLEDEAYLNDMYSRFANARYDTQQPYGFDFGYREPDFQGGRVTPKSMALSYDGEYTTPPENPQLPSVIDDVAGVVGPLAKTAGSYALPMLFSMLMRGGK